MRAQGAIYADRKAEMRDQMSGRQKGTASTKAEAQRYRQKKVQNAHEEGLHIVGAFVSQGRNRTSRVA